MWPWVPVATVTEAVAAAHQAHHCYVPCPVQMRPPHPLRGGSFWDTTPSAMACVIRKRGAGQSLATGHRVGSLAGGSDLVAELAAQGPDKVLPADSAQSRGLARVGARCQGWRAGTLLCLPQLSGSAPAATVALMRLPGGFPTPPVPDSPAPETPEPQEDSGLKLAAKTGWQPRDKHAPDSDAAAITIWSLTSRPSLRRPGSAPQTPRFRKCQPILHLLASPVLGTKSTHTSLSLHCPTSLTPVS